MTLLSLTAAFGVLLFISGLPPVRRASISRRVELYLVGSRLRSLPDDRVGKVMSWLSPDGDQDLSSRLRAAGAEVDAAGYRLQQAVWMTAGAIASTTVGLWLGRTSGGFDPIALTVLGCLGAAIGYGMRDRRLVRAVNRRNDVLSDELPVALDLLTLAVMSGEAVHVAIDRVARTVGGEVGREFSAVSADIRSGTPPAEAFEDLSRRVREPGVARFADSVIVALESGSPIAEVLRAQADDLRDARGRRLIELGGRREVLMLVPVVFLILPVIVAFALYPGLVSLELFVP